MNSIFCEYIVEFWISLPLQILEEYFLHQVLRNTIGRDFECMNFFQILKMQNLCLVGRELVSKMLFNINMYLQINFCEWSLTNCWKLDEVIFTIYDAANIENESVDPDEIDVTTLAQPIEAYHCKVHIFPFLELNHVFWPSQNRILKWRCHILRKSSTRKGRTFGNWFQGEDYKLFHNSFKIHHVIRII